MNRNSGSDLTSAIARHYLRFYLFQMSESRKTLKISNITKLSYSTYEISNLWNAYDC